MNLERLLEVLQEVHDRAGNMSVYVTKDNGTIVPLMEGEVSYMRDGGEAVPIMVLKR